MVNRLGTIGFIGDVALLSKELRVGGGFPPLVANLEGPLGNDGDPAPAKVNLWSDETLFSDQLASYLVAVSLANNHVLDFGATQLNQTLEQLSQHGIASYGLSTAENERGGVVIEAQGRTLGLLGYACPTTNATFEHTQAGAVRRLELQRVLEDIKSLRREGADFVVVTPHWGVEQVELPRPTDVSAARSMIDAGATAVIGHHSHCIQGFEVYRDRTIVYGLGSTIWPDMALSAEYDPDGGATGTYRRRQRRWNRRALLATLDLSSGAVAVQETRFRSGRLSISQRSAAKWDLTKRSHRLLDEARFKRVAYRHMLRDRLFSAAHQGTLWRALDPRRVFRLLRDMTRTIKDQES